MFYYLYIEGRPVEAFNTQRDARVYAAIARQNGEKNVTVVQREPIED